MAVPLILVGTWTNDKKQRTVGGREMPLGNLTRVWGTILVFLRSSSEIGIVPPDSPSMLSPNPLLKWPSLLGERQGSGII